MIVVNDGSTDDTLAAAASTPSASSRSRRRRATRRDRAGPRATTGRRADPRLLVVDKENGGKADAPQRRRSTTAATATSAPSTRTWCSRAARSRGRCARSSATRRVVGLTSYFENARDPSRSLAGRRPLRRARHEARCSPSRRFDYLRAFFNNRIGWARLNFMLCAAGAFQIWRRDLVEELDGWSRGVHVRGHRVHVPRPSSCSASAAARTAIACLPGLRRRHRRAGLGAEARLPARALAARDPRDVLGEPADVLQPALRHRRACSGMPFYLLSEIVAPIFEVLAVATLVAGAAAGLVDWWEFGVLTLAITLANSALTHRRARSCSTSRGGRTASRASCGCSR